MKSLIKHFSQNALESFKDFSNSLNQRINSFNFDDLDEMFANAQNSLNKATTKLKSRFSETQTDFTVNIPYDRDSDDSLTTKIEDGKFIAFVEKKVNKENETKNVERKIEIYIPDDVDIHSMKRHYDEKSHRMYFVFDKKSVK